MINPSAEGLKNPDCPGFRNIEAFTLRRIESLDYGEKKGLRQCVQVESNSLEKPEVTESYSVHPRHNQTTAALDALIEKAKRMGFAADQLVMVKQDR
jgi:hypothetical protein